MSLLSALIDLVLPQRCAGCGAAVGLLCAECHQLLGGQAWPCPPRPPPPGLPTPWAVAPYDGAVRAMIVAHKERGRTGLTVPLGGALARAVLGAMQSLNAAPTSTRRPVMSSALPRVIVPTMAAGGAASLELVVLVPVPSAAAAVRRRGHDPTLRIVRAAAGELRRRGVPVRHLPVLAQARRVADQAGLSADQRVANLDGALVVRRPAAVAGVRVIVVDDVVTTGASLVEATRALRAAGAEVTATAVVAATQRRGSHRQQPG